MQPNSYDLNAFTIIIMVPHEGCHIGFYPNMHQVENLPIFSYFFLIFFFKGKKIKT